MPTDSQASPSTEKPRAKAGSANRKGQGGNGSYSQGSSPDIHRSLPHSLEAEQGVLGSMLLSPMEVTGECVERISEKAFYLPAHATIYSLLVECWTDQKPVDLILLTQMLRDRQLLDAIGGPAFITHLYTFTPTAANASYYIDIVREKFILRQIISTCTECASRAYEEQGEVPTLLDDVEREILAIGQNRFKDAIPQMKDQVMEAIETIEKLYERRGALTGLPSGFVNMDKMTSGLHPAEMIVIAARPSMGKTAFAMNIAEHVALVAKHPVAIFSLEMSSQQLVQRLLCSRARVNLQKVRDGFLSERDFPNLTQAASKLAESQIFIDDTAGLSILELRAKARRFKQMHDIQLIVIDYLQLLRSTSRRAQDNRQLEIAEISSGVKALAKELKIPIIVLAQLNRQPEARSGGKPRLSDLRESGCLAGDTLITLADTGERVTIRQLSERPHQTPVRVQAVNPDYTVSSHVMTRAFFSGRKCIYQLKTSTGRSIKASANHPFLKLAGWTALEELTAGDRIALPRQIHSEQPANPLPDDELILLAHLIGDGCILPGQPYHYTSADEQNLEVVRTTAERLFGIQGRLVKQKNWFHLYLPTPTRLTHGKRHPITEWFEKLGLQRCRSYEKRLPAALFQCGEEKIALFLKHLWSTDGNVSWKRLTGRQDAGAIYYASASRELAEQVQHLLLRLSISSSLREAPSALGYRMMYHLHIEGSTSQLEFLTRVGCVGVRGEIIPELTVALRRIQSNPNKDAVPKEVWSLVVQPAKERLGVGWREVCARLQMAYCGSTLFKHGVSRARMLRLHDALLCVRLLQLACSDVFWDEIVSIEKLGEEEVYDATVEDVHNFVANDIIVHNSIEQDADLVGLLVRSEYYAEDEEAREEVRGEAELIIAKQRNGPVGEVKLTFFKEFTRFEDRADTPGEH